MSDFDPDWFPGLLPPRPRPPCSESEFAAGPLASFADAFKEIATAPTSEANRAIDRVAYDARRNLDRCARIAAALADGADIEIEAHAMATDLHRFEPKRFEIVWPWKYTFVVMGPVPLHVEVAFYKLPAMPADRLLRELYARAASAVASYGERHPEWARAIREALVEVGA